MIAKYLYNFWNMQHLITSCVADHLIKDRDISLVIEMNVLLPESFQNFQMTCIWLKYKRAFFGFTAFVNKQLCNSLMLWGSGGAAGPLIICLRLYFHSKLWEVNQGGKLMTTCLTFKLWIKTWWKSGTKSPPLALEAAGWLALPSLPP